MCFLIILGELCEKGFQFPERVAIHWLRTTAVNASLYSAIMPCREKLVCQALIIPLGKSIQMPQQYIEKYSCSTILRQVLEMLLF